MSSEYYYSVNTVIICCLCVYNCEEINLNGNAGEAYAIQIRIGGQHLSVLIDTGSTTLVLAAYPVRAGQHYFHKEQSRTLNVSGIDIHGAFTVGSWRGSQASDLVEMHSLPGVPTVRTDVALITDSKYFFSEESYWQGILGLAYLPIAVTGANGPMRSWLDALGEHLNQPISFQFEPCGLQNPANTSTYGYFRVLDENTTNIDQDNMFRTPVLHRDYYDVPVLAVRVVKISDPNESSSGEDMVEQLDIDMCTELNAYKNILDSGTTQIKLPNSLFYKIGAELRAEFSKLNVKLKTSFWEDEKSACWSKPQQWSGPWLAIDILSADADNQYITLEIPPQNYMVLTKIAGEGSNTTYCYMFGVGAGGTDTVLGFTAMEGFKVTFNRTAGWVGWETSHCGPNTRIRGPYNTSTSLKTICELARSTQTANIVINVFFFIFMISALGVFSYYLYYWCIGNGYNTADRFRGWFSRKIKVQDTQDHKTQNP